MMSNDANGDRFKKAAALVMLGPWSGRFSLRGLSAYQVREFSPRCVELMAYATGPTIASQDETWRDDIDLGNGWELDARIHRAVARRHGPIAWSRSEPIVVSVEGTLSPVVYGYAADGRVVAIAAPRAPWALLKQG